MHELKCWAVLCRVKCADVEQHERKDSEKGTRSRRRCVWLHFTFYHFGIPWMSAHISRAERALRWREIICECEWRRNSDGATATEGNLLAWGLLWWDIILFTDWLSGFIWWRIIDAAVRDYRSFIKQHICSAWFNWPVCNNNISLQRHHTDHC